jgi:hypothetical protein
MEGTLKTRPMNKPIYDPKNPKPALEYGREEPPKQPAPFNTS